MYPVVLGGNMSILMAYYYIFKNFLLVMLEAADKVRYK